MSLLLLLLFWIVRLFFLRTVSGSQQHWEEHTGISHIPQWKIPHGATKTQCSQKKKNTRVIERPQMVQLMAWAALNVSVDLVIQSGPSTLMPSGKLFEIQFSSVAQLGPTLCDPMNCSTPGLPVHHQLPEFTQIRVHGVSDAIQPSHPPSSPSSPAPNPSQHQSLFQWVNSSHEVAKVLEFQL